MSTPQPQNSLVETKVAASSATGVVMGMLSWALVTFVPSFKSGIPVDLQPFIPFAAGWLVSTAAGYLAPHTHRPDLGGLVQLPAPVTAYPAQQAQLPGEPPGPVSAAPTEGGPRHARPPDPDDAPTEVHTIRQRPPGPPLPP